MNKNIIAAALSSLSKLDVVAIAKIIVATPNPEVATLMAIGLYKEPVLPETTNADKLYSSYAGTMATLVEFRPLQDDRTQVSYKVQKLVKKYVKNESDAKRWADGYNTSTSEIETEEYPYFVEKIERNTGFCSVADWLK